MRLASTLLFLLIGFCLAGCEKPNISGHAYVVKGGGNVNPAAAQTVYLIPEASKEALFSRAINEVAPSVLADHKQAISAACPTIKQTITKLDATFKKELQDIEISGSSSPSECNSLQDGLALLEDVFKDYKSKHLKRVTRIELELKALKSKREAEVKALAARLKMQELKKLSASIEPGVYRRGSYSFYIKNNTDYYLKGAISYELFSNGIMLESYKMPLRYSIEDKYGFKMGVNAAPHKKMSKSFSSYTAEYLSSNPDIQLFASQNDVRVKDGRIVPNQVIITDATFAHTPVGEMVGERIRYTSEEVSFYDMALQKKYSADNRIFLLEENLRSINNGYEASDMNRDYHLAKTATDSCIATQSRLKEINSRQIALGRIEKQIDLCIDGKINTKTFRQDLKALNFPAPISGVRLADVTKLVSEAAKKQVLKRIFDSSRKTDTSINGFFKFNETPKGDYLLYSAYKDNFANGFWLAPITVKADAQFDLSNKTMKSGSFNSYLESALTQLSKGVVEE